MKKLAVILLTLSFLATFTPSVFAEGGAADTERWVCLQNQHCWSQAAGYEACSEAHRGNGHVAKLSTKPGFEPLVGQPTYIVECIATANGQICTTGDSSADQIVYKKDNVAALQAATEKYEFQGLWKEDGTTTVANPAEWSGPYEWGDLVLPGAMHTWFALNYWDPTVTVTGGEGGQQQGTFDFETAEKDCVKIGWDPYGRVFDAGTLEPILGASVTLHMKDKDTFRVMTTSDLAGGNLINPQTTLEDGEFSFVVPDGEYKLITPGTLADTTTLDTNYTKAYSDIYPALTGEVIVQKGSIQHRDIPVATKGTNRAVKLMEYMYQSLSDGTLVIEGRTSHPLTKLNVKTSKVTPTNPTVKTPYRTAATFSADKLGKFRIEVDQSKFERTDEYTEVFSDLEMVKVDLRQPTVRKGLMRRVIAWFDGLIKKVEAQTATTTVKFEPIPQYVEGYAYDAAGNVLPNATVGVYVTFSKKPYATTKTDSKGFFKLTSEYLPNFAYTLQYTTAAGAVISTKPSVFLAQNQKHLAANKVNPYLAKDIKNHVAPTASKSRGSSSSAKTGIGGAGGNGGLTGSNTAGGKENLPAQQQLASQMFPILLVIVLLIITAVVGVVAYMKKKKETSLPPPVL